MSVASENGRNRIMIYGPKSRKCHLTASHRGATTSSVPGAVLFDDFDSFARWRSSMRVAISGNQG
jgi:hypothetical protein